MLNRSDRSRRAYSLHATDGRASYAASNWLQPSPDLPLRGSRWIRVLTK